MVYKKTAQKLKAERKAKDKALKKEKPKKAVALSKQIRDAQRLLKKVCLRLFISSLKVLDQTVMRSWTLSSLQPSFIEHHPSPSYRQQKGL